MSLIQVTNLTFGYDGSYENFFENVSFQIDTSTGCVYAAADSPAA